ncbi:MAG: DUF1836 domain-containing protein [Oscillospiraceae bacterium]
MDNSPALEPCIFSEDAVSFRLPRWNELPDLELYMDQVITLINKYIGPLSADTDAPLTPSMINNYVKLDILPAPIKKKYSRIHISRLIMICVFKPVLPIPLIGTLIDILLRSRTDEEMFNYFSEHYELAFTKTNNIIRESLGEITRRESDSESILSLAVMQAAAVSGGGKLLAEKALAELMNGEPMDNDSKY